MLVKQRLGRDLREHQSAKGEGGDAELRRREGAHPGIGNKHAEQEHLQH